MKTLTQTVTKIVGYQVTEAQAKNYALNNYGVLATHIRNEFLGSLNPPQKTVKKKQLKDIKVFGTVSKKYKQTQR